MLNSATSIRFDIIILAVFVLLALFVIFGISGWLIYVWYKYKDREGRSLKSVLLQVRVARANEIKIDAMEQLFASLYSIKKGGWKMKFSTQPVISFELVARRESISFYVWTFQEYRDMVEKQINGAYPDAEILEVEEYNLFAVEGKVAYKSFQLKKSDYYPLKTYKELPTDPLSAITSAMAKMGEGESAAVQLIVSPADSKWQAGGRKYISSTKKQEANPEEAAYKVSAKELEAVENKIGRPGFEVSLRMVVVSQDQNMAKMHLDNLASAFTQFNSEFNSLGSRKIRRKTEFVQDFLYRYQPKFNFFGNRKSILNSEELATIFHFPNKLIITPHINWLNAKTAPAPAQIPTQGLYLGKSTYRGTSRPVYISDKDRMRHTYIVGKTGTGKSELLKEMIMQDIRGGKGLCFLDPHGDAVEDILTMIPPERAEDVIYFQPSDYERPMGINLLEAETEQQKHFVATNVINMMYKLFDPYKTGIVGPRFEHAVRNAMLTAMSEQGSTFVELMRILTDAKFVQEILPKVQDPIVRRYWTDQIAQTSDFHKSETLDYITSKFGRFVTNKLIRNIIGQSKSSFDFREVMDSGKLLLINLSKGELGEENSNFLGLIIVPRILMAAMSRANVPENQRRDFFLYVDEFQNFATPDFAQILSEARKYHLSLNVANQFIGQIDEEVKNAVFGNVGTTIAFRIGVNDASFLSHVFAPTFGEDDLLNVERFHAYVTTLVNNEPVPAFSMDTTKDLSELEKQKNTRVAEIIKEMSRMKYGRDMRQVELEIDRRAKL